MFPPDDVSPSERLKAGRGKSDRWRTSRVTEGVCLTAHARRLSAIGTSRRLDGSGPLLALLQETRSLGSGPLPAPSPGTPPRGTARPVAELSSPTAAVRTPSSPLHVDEALACLIAASEPALNFLFSGGSGAIRQNRRPVVKVVFDGAPGEVRTLGR